MANCRALTGDEVEAEHGECALSEFSNKQIQVNHSESEKERGPLEVADEQLLSELTEDPRRGVHASEPLSTSGLCLSPTFSQWKGSQAGRNRDLSYVLVGQGN